MSHILELSMELFQSHIAAVAIFGDDLWVHCSKVRVNEVHFLVDICTLYIPTGSKKDCGQ